MATLNDLKLKKGNTVFLFGNWNGTKEATVDFYIQKFTVHSIGKKRCYLLYNEDVNMRREYGCTGEINAALTFDEAVEKCKAYQPIYTENELKGFEWRMANYSNNKQYVTGIQEMFNHLMKAPQRIVINPYSDNNPQTI